MEKPSRYLANSSTALEQLRGLIHQYESTPGTPLPTERELAEMFGVGRREIRRALDVLEEEGRIWRKQGKIGHPVDVVGLFGSAEFIIYYGFGVFFTALLDDPRPLLAGIWAVAIMSHVSLLQRVRFAWKRYRFVDPGLATADDVEPEAEAS